MNTFLRTVCFGFGVMAAVGAAGCSGAEGLDPQTEEELGSTTQQLAPGCVETLAADPTRPAHPDVQVCNGTLSGGFLMCPPDTALVGMDLAGVVDRVACTKKLVTWDAQLIRNTTNLSSPSFDFASPQRVLTPVHASSNFRWIATGVNFTTGQIQVRLATGPGQVGPQLVRATGTNYVHYKNPNGGTEEVQLCPFNSAGDQRTRHIHGANPIFTFNPPISNLAPFNFSCEPSLIP